MVYERKHFIRDLYTSTNLLNKFDIVEFENIELFIESLNKNYFSFSNKPKRMIINLNSQTQLDLFKTFLFEIENIDNENIIFIKLNFNSNIEDLEQIKEKKFFILVNYNEEKTAYYESLNNRFANIVIYTEINYNNYQTIINNIPTLHLQHSLSSYLFAINYSSFEELKMSDLHKLEFFINNLSYWSENLLYNVGKSVFRECYVSEDFKLYPGRQAFVDGFCIFDLKKYSGVGPENIPYRDLNTLLSYLDIPQDQYFPIEGNLRFINLYQNYKIYGNYCKLSVVANKFVRRIK